MNKPKMRTTTARVGNVGVSRKHLRIFVLMVVTAAGLFLCWRMTVPFLPAGAWALTLAVLFTPLQRWLESRLKRPSVAALLAVLVVGLIAVVPAAFVGQKLIVEAEKGAELFETKFSSGEWRHALENRPRLAQLADTIQHHVDLPGIVKSLAARLSSAAGAIVKGSVYQVIGFCLTFYLLFFFLRDRRALLQSLRSLSPLPDEEMDRLYRQVSDTIHATVYGTLAVSLLQGLLGGLMFWWLGLVAPLFWGGVMALLAVVPVLGAFVVWVPAVLLLAAQGEWVKALVLALWGMLVVGTVDNLLRPILVGNRLKQHTVLAFISVVGGLILFGPAGLILGPVALTVTISLLALWTDRSTAGAPNFLDENQPPPARPAPPH